MKPLLLSLSLCLLLAGCQAHAQAPVPYAEVEVVVPKHQQLRTYRDIPAYQQPDPEDPGKKHVYYRVPMGRKLVLFL